MTGLARLALTAGVVLLMTGAVNTQAKRYPLESAEGLQPHNVKAEPATLDGKKGIRLTLLEESARRAASMTPEQRLTAGLNSLAVVEGSDFSNGVIEVELAGAAAPGAPEGARGFVGVAFRLQKDNKTYDAFYLRPTNGRAEDQERRNHSAQYISHPDWPWFRLRKEAPSKYETYVDLVSGAWTKIKIEVRGQRARFYVHDAKQPTLIVNDVKSGPKGRGAVALWLDPGTIAHFRNLTVEQFPDTSR
jgi:hypothetical protein